MAVDLDESQEPVSDLFHLISDDINWDEINWDKLVLPGEAAFPVSLSRDVTTDVLTNPAINIAARTRSSRLSRPSRLSRLTRPAKSKKRRRRGRAKSPMAEYKEYVCKFCGIHKVSSSRGSDGYQRIRCGCGGHRRDMTMRLHSMWVLCDDLSRGVGVRHGRVSSIIAAPGLAQCDGLTLNSPF
jgi:hypothetical protein